VKLEGWPIVGWATLAIGAMIAAITALVGSDEAGIRMVVRATARTSVVLFTAAFVASALHRAWPSAVSRWMLANRRYLGVSFAVSHTAHLLAILALAGWSVGKMVADAGPVALILGGGAYVFLAAMTATSFDRTAAWLGPTRWRRLHTIGAYYIWTIFFVSFTPRVTQSPIYAPFALLLLATLVLRLRARPTSRLVAAASPTPSR